MLGGVGATNLDVELVAAVAGVDDDGATDEGTEGLEDFLAELLQNGNGDRGQVPVPILKISVLHTYSLILF